MTDIAVSSETKILAQNRRQNFGVWPWVVVCSREDSNPPDYPIKLLDPQTCARELLCQIYSRIPKTSPLDRNARDAEIFLLFVLGKSTAQLAEIYKLSVQRIRKIIRRTNGEKLE